MPDVSRLPTSEAPPMLSTPDTRIFEENVSPDCSRISPTSDKELHDVYEIERTAAELWQGQWTRIALQFPDHLLVDAPRVSRALSQQLRDIAISDQEPPTGDTNRINTDGIVKPSRATRSRIFVLADTSYGACCVDEVAAEHADADVVVHYGRACLSPTTRLPVVYSYTHQPFANDAAIRAFCQKYPDLNERVILMADLPYQWCLQRLSDGLQSLGYINLFTTSVVQDAQSPLPNRTTPSKTSNDSLQNWSLYHISEPTPSLLLTLASRVRSITFYPIGNTATPVPQQALEATTAASLRRRYALLTSLAIVPIFGILVNTLSVRNYMQILRHVKHIIAAAGKASYTFVVGKVNAAKVANFSEVGGWVVIGCWESSLFEAKDFWRPIITPFELELALQRDDQRQWTGEWSSNYEDLLRTENTRKRPDRLKASGETFDDSRQPRDSEELDPEEESAPPEYDLRTGRYVSHGITMGQVVSLKDQERDAADAESSSSVTRRPEGDLIHGNHISPAAQYLQTQRTWQGLGSDFNSTSQSDLATGAVIEQGRHGIARGYRHQQDPTPR
ncbi:MAG: hypothetical protein Q9159_001469 [Coniocarpon cinnabarinum]